MTNVKAANDWATVSFQDPMDMKQNTDLGWHIWSIDQPLSSLTNVGMNVSNANGTDLFHGTATTQNPILFLLESSNRFSAKLGRTGDNFPIDATTYKQLTFRMCLTDAGTDPLGQHVRLRTESGSLNASFNNSVGLVYRTPNDADEAGLTQDGSFTMYAGCQIYSLDMTALPHGLAGAPWAGTLRSLRWDPIFIGGTTIDLDWVRLVAPTTNQTFTWTGGSADLYLDKDTDATNNLGMLYKDGILARGVSSGYTYPMAALEGGNYFVRICPFNAAVTSSSCAYTGQIKVNGIPTVKVTAPTEEGSADDFATVQLNNAWDFNAVSDVDFTNNIASLTIDPAFPAQRPDGTDLGPVQVMRGTPSASGPTDAYFYTLFFAGTGRGVNKKIDADRYRVLTIDAGLPGPRDINTGSIARVVWKSTAEAAENVSQDILIQHRAGVNIIDTISVDMKTMLLETPATTGQPPGTLGVSGWTGQIENFRFDPHEFPAVTEFWVKRIKLAAFETIGSTNTYTIKWTAVDAFDSTTATGAKVSAFYEAANAQGTSPSGGARTPIGTCAAIAAANGQCPWNTGAVLKGTYFVFLSIDDGVNTNGAYSKYPVIVDQAATPKPRIVLDRSVLNFGGTQNGQLTTPPQPLRLSIVPNGAPSGTAVHWTATTQGSAANLFTVSPTSGTGPAVLTVSIGTTPIDNRVVGVLGTVVVTSADADNSTQSTTVFLEMKQTTAAPFGDFSTPAEGSVLQGSLAVTGWVLDDIGVSSLNIYRDAHPSDNPAAVSGGRVFIATATLVDGARPDIVAAFPNAAANYNAGWGYLMLTRGLIWDGGGPFKLYAVATDLDGHSTLIGTKTVTVNNATAVKPFGAIDTPVQGGTVSGSVFNFGWGLTPGGTCRIPANGVQVSIDSGPLQAVTYGTSDDVRADIASGFPGFTNSAAAGGHFLLDTTLYANGVHTIGWLVTDDCARADGVGSRFFSIQNSSLTIARNGNGNRGLAGATTTFARLGEDAGVLMAPRSTTPVSFGLGMTAPRVFTRAAATMGRSEVSIRQTERVVLNVGRREAATTYAAYRVVDGRLMFLPAGASFDTRQGTFYWQPAPGFAGDYDFVFVKTKKGTDVSQVPVRVTVGPSTATLRAGLFRPVVTLAARPE